MKIYISGKITGLNEAVARRLFEEGEKEALKLESISEKSTINPFKIPVNKEQPDWHDYMAADITELLRCDAIYMLRNWGDSRGARVEYAIARELGLTIHFQS